MKGSQQDPTGEKNLQKYDKETYVLSEICVYCRFDRLEGRNKQTTF